jgi:hypothetical protein
MRLPSFGQVLWTWTFFVNAGGSTAAKLLESLGKDKVVELLEVDVESSPSGFSQPWRQLKLDRPVYIKPALEVLTAEELFERLGSIQCQAMSKHE